MTNKRKQSAFMEWLNNRFKHYPKEWQTHQRGDTYELCVVEAAFNAGRRYERKRK